MFGALFGNGYRDFTYMCSVRDFFVKAVLVYLFSLAFWFLLVC